MQKTTVKIPIYQFKLIIVLDKDLSYIEKTYGTSSLEGFGAVAMRHPFQYRTYVVGFTDKNHLSNIAHEIVHLKNMVFQDIQAKLDAENDEPEAYLTGYLFDEIYNFLIKSK
jgi:hypothetical protein